MLRMFIYIKIAKNENMYKLTVFVKTKIVFAHDQKHVRSHYFSVRPNTSPKCSPSVYCRLTFNSNFL